MKAKIISQTIYEGWLAFSHGMGEKINRIIIPEADNLAIALHNKKLYVFTGFGEGGKGFEVLKEIEVPDDFVQKAMAFLKTKEELTYEAKTLLGDFCGEEGKEEEKKEKKKE